MKNITVSVPDDVYRRARIRAAEEGRSVSALVVEFLNGLSDREAEFARLESLQHEVQAEIVVFAGAGRLDREALNSRALR